MALYLSIVLLAAMVALPADFGQNSYYGPNVFAIIWGTTLGLALAHWFSFELVAVGFAGGRLLRDDIRIGSVQVVTALGLASATTLVVILAEDSAQIQAAAFVPAAVLGLAGYGAARSGGRTRFRALVWGLAALAVGFSVATAKALLAGH